MFSFIMNTISANGWFKVKHFVRLTISRFFRQLMRAPATTGISRLTIIFKGNTAQENVKYKGQDMCTVN